jgi:hypothetical protein
MGENCARLRDAIDKPVTRLANPGTEMPPGILGAPLCVGPHDGARKLADNASTPTQAGVNMRPVAPSYGKPTEQWDRK